MANYLINSPSSETVGTDSADLFDLRTIQGTTIFGNDGADTVSATTLAGSAAKLNVGAGNDTVTVTAGGTLFAGSVLAGSGDDVITADALFSAAIIRGGSGSDTIDVMAAAGSKINKSTINGNDNNDLLTAVIESGSDSSLIAAGKGKDTVDLTFSGVNAFTINGGAGHDSMTLSAGGSLSSTIINGGAGKDTIEFEAGAAAALSANSLVDGGSEADRIRFAAGVAFAGGSATIAGGAGADTILFSAGVDLNEGFILGGDGQDSIKISATFDAGTLNGGAGADTVTLGTYGVSGSNGGFFQGGAGADKFNLGKIDSLASGTVYESGGSTIHYASFDESNLDNLDVVSATFSAATGDGATDVDLFTISQDVVTTAVAENGIKNPASFTATNGVATFTSTFSDTLTARVVEVDRLLGKGAAVYFTNGSGNSHYVFVQGGAAAGSGTDDDLIIEINTAVTALVVAGNTSISVQSGIRSASNKTKNSTKGVSFFLSQTIQAFRSKPSTAVTALVVAGNTSISVQAGF